MSDLLENLDAGQELQVDKANHAVFINNNDQITSGGQYLAQSIHGAGES